MTAAPIYTLRHAFEADPLCSCFGLGGLRATVPLLEPDIYVINEGRAEVGSAIRHTAYDDWSIDLDDGTRAGPGFIIV